MTKTFELTPNNRQRSFYGKAIVEERKSGCKILFSYGTPVARITKTGHFVRTWGGYSATTMKHINAFVDRYSVPGGGKAWWDSQAVRKAIW